RQRPNGAVEVLDRDRSPRLALGGADRLEQRLLLRLGQETRIDVAIEGGARLLLFLAQDVGGALGAGKQVLAVVRVEEASKRLYPADDEEDFILIAKRE